MTWKRESLIEFRHWGKTGDIHNSFNSTLATGASPSQAALLPNGKSGSPRPQRSGLAMTWKRESLIEFRHCEERSDVAIHAASAKPVKMDRHLPTGRDSR